MIQVVPVNSRKLRRAFINLPYELYKNDPHWIPPLKLERKELINPKKNPFFENAEVQLFVAFKEGKPVGRISAQINRLHNERYHEQTGHFGLFESVENSGVSEALFKAAEKWLGERGMNKICGPFSFSINEEVGLLIDGFDSPPFPYMAHNPPYYQQLMAQAGYQKIKDLLAWKYLTQRDVPEAAHQIAEAVRKYPGLVVREVNLKEMEKELRIISEVFNSAWSKNWGFIPWTDSEIKKTAKDMKMVLDPKMALIAEVNGKPAAISIAIPNYHEAIRDLNGRLFPFGIFKLLYRLKTRKIKSSRQVLLGIKKEYRSDVLGALSVLFYTEMHQRSRELGHWGGETSWTLEDNEKINHGIELMGGEVYKRYRIFEKSLI